MKRISVNPQGLARGNKALMACLLPFKDEYLISADLSAGEPTVTSHFSQDENFMAANFTMVGKKPYYKGEILMIGDPYIMGASVSPLGSKAVREAFEASYDGISGYSKWVEDPDFMKDGPLKKVRKLHKILILAKNYGQLAKGSVSFAADQGHAVSLSDMEEFDYKYRNVLHPKVTALARALRKRYKKDGHLITTFNYRLVPSKARDAFNYFIQSHVSGIMKVITLSFFDKVKRRGLNVRYQACIHDEVIFACRGAEETIKAAYDESVAELNDMLSWTVDIRSGWVRGNNYFEAK